MMENLTRVDIKYSDDVIKHIDISTKLLISFASTTNKPDNDILPVAHNQWADISNKDRILTHLRVIYGLGAKYKIKEFNIESYGF